MPADLVERLNESETYVTGYSAGDNKKYQFGFVIIKDLLRMVKGSMQVESWLDQGTKVTVHFPLPEKTGSNQ
jgi:sensor histidine kinase regulating citrate/malate metabolism